MISKVSSWGYGGAGVISKVSSYSEHIILFIPEQHHDAGRPGNQA
jgi:hypothetical protein